MAWRVIRKERTDSNLHRPIAIAMAATLVGMHVFGLNDSISLGAKIGLLFWLALGLLSVADAGPRGAIESL
jgi:hypothetical protein